MTSQPLSVGVHSPQEIVREGIVSLLSRHPDKFCITPLPTGPGDRDPDVVVYDVIALLDGDTAGLSYLVEMTTSKVLAVGRVLRPDLVCQALTLGVDAFVDLSVDEKELLSAVESAATGWRRDAEEAVAHRLGADVGLTERETEVLALIAQGLPNQQVAARLFLSINSVKTYVRTAYRKIGVEDRKSVV